MFAQWDKDTGKSIGLSATDNTSICARCVRCLTLRVSVWSKETVKEFKGATEAQLQKLYAAAQRALKDETGSAELA